MAQTDARAGFRLPWSSERSTSEITETDQVDAAGEPTDVASETDRTAAHDAPVGGDATEEGSPTADAASQGPEASEPSPQPTSAPPSRKPSKFLADLTKAMQAAAEESRALTVAQFETEAKAYIEQIRDRSSGEAAALRQTADDDVQSVREWSKAEIARIREETESRITDRKSRLESEIEEHASRIEREISQVQGRVSAFEEEMAGFFERLLREDDPTRFATLAERLPEPPTFEEMSAGTDSPASRIAARAPIAARSLAANMAVGLVFSLSSRRAPRYPPSSVYSPGAMKRWCSSPRRCIARS